MCSNLPRCFRDVFWIPEGQKFNWFSGLYLFFRDAGIYIEIILLVEKHKNFLKNVLVANNFNPLSSRKLEAIKNYLGWNHFHPFRFCSHNRPEKAKEANFQVN
jgi:hypothetical protein